MENQPQNSAIQHQASGNNEKPIRERIAETLEFFFPGALNGPSTTEEVQFILDRLVKMDIQAIHVTHFNQLLHYVHQAGVTPGFFRYYFMSEQDKHPYPVDQIMDPTPGLDEKGISSLEQLEWGLRRFYTDALLYFGNIRTAYRYLRTMSYEDLVEFFSEQRFDSEFARSRGYVLAFQKIPIDDRYLISEIACKTYASESNSGKSTLEEILLKTYQARGRGKAAIKALVGESKIEAIHDPQNQLVLEFVSDDIELLDTEIENEAQLHDVVSGKVMTFEKARRSALENTKLYLSIVNELDVYVATSMRRRDDFRNMARDCEYIFKQQGLRRFRLRYFDPTMSAAENHEDKGLIECLMVKCAKALLYFAGDKDSFGKDAEVAMALSLGRPVVILCPDDANGETRMKFFRDVHPLGRLIRFENGVACGAIVTQKRDVAAKLLERIFDNGMEYDIEQNGDGYFRLRERLTGSVVRLQTNSEIVRESFFNYYHNIP